jgi:hypothetical protein
MSVYYAELNGKNRVGRSSSGPADLNIPEVQESVGEGSFPHPACQISGPYLADRHRIYAAEDRCSLTSVTGGPSMKEATFHVAEHSLLKFRFARKRASSRCLAVKPVATTFPFPDAG